MCGIVGIHYFDPERPVDPAHLRAMADRIVHRGPDDSGFHVEGNVGIGMRRLSIIDVGGGHQPIYTPDGRYVIVFNGEMFNYQEQHKELAARGHVFATNSDTEVVLHLYAQHGLAFTDHLNGMFGIAIWDRQARELVVVRDRIGIKPLYYYRDEQVLLFASEIKALLAFPGLRPELDWEGLGAYLRYGFAPAPYTLFKGIRKLAPAHRIKVAGRAVEDTEYWRVSYRDKLRESESELKERLYDLLADAVRRQMIADVPIGAFLSGGFDSSGIVHLMSQSAGSAVSTYSVGFGEGFSAYNELDAANRFARDYHTNQHQIVVKPDVTELLWKLVPALDEPVADSSFLLTYLVAKLARESSTVILSGVGGDEIFGGYRRYLNVTLGNYLGAVPGVVRNYGMSPLLRLLPADRNGRLSNFVRLARSYLAAADLPVEEQYGRYTQIFDAGALSELARGAQAVPDYYARYSSECDSGELLDKLMYFDLKMSLPEQLLMLTDKMTMAVSLEGRVPLLDHRVVELAARLPSSLKVNGLKLRHLQKEAFRGRLPDYVYAQRKKGFGAPVGAWLREGFRPLMEEVLGESYLRSQGLFAPQAVSRLVRSHLDRSEDHTDQLWALTVFQLWYRSYGLS
jgi:asparagine synthase (glutamine-hydrolysing)